MLQKTAQSSPMRRRVARAAAAGAILASTAGVAIVGTAESASAETTMRLARYQIGFYPTWFFGETKLCVKPEGNFAGRVRINVLSTGAGEYVNTPVGQEKCIYRWWWSSLLLVNNIGPGTVQVTTY